MGDSLADSPGRAGDERHFSVQVEEGFGFFFARLKFLDETFIIWGQPDDKSASCEKKRETVHAKNADHLFGRAVAPELRGAALHLSAALRVADGAAALAATLA